MNKNIIIVLAGGFLIAVLVAVVVQFSLKGGKKSSDDGNSAKVQVLVAARDLSIGRELSDGDTKWQEWPEASVFEGAILRQDNQSTGDTAKGRVIQAISKGQPIHPGLLVGETKANFIAAKLKEGMRAVGIPVKAHNIAGGFIGPGDYVDVLVTYKVTPQDKENPDVQEIVSKQASETVIENVRVLAADQQAIRDEDKAKVARTVTLEVDSRGAERLVLAAKMGEITLALRGIGDNTLKADTGLTTDVNMSKVLKGVVKAQNGDSGNDAGSVRVYNGDQMGTMSVRQPEITE